MRRKACRQPSVFRGKQHSALSSQRSAQAKAIPPCPPYSAYCPLPTADCRLCPSRPVFVGDASATERHELFQQSYHRVQSPLRRGCSCNYQFCYDRVGALLVSVPSSSGMLLQHIEWAGNLIHNCTFQSPLRRGCSCNAWGRLSNSSGVTVSVPSSLGMLLQLGGLQRMQW